MYKNFESTANAVNHLSDGSLIRVVYISKATILSGIKSAKTLAKIEDVAVAHNTVNELSGILCYGNGYFLQCLEGKKEDVLPLLQRIFLDSRHKQVNVIEVKQIAVRQFYEWGMRSLLLENWLWRDIHEDYVNELKHYIPFLPQTWTLKRINRFLKAINRTDIPIISHKRSFSYSDGLTFSSEYIFIQALLVVCGCLIALLYFNH